MAQVAVLLTVAVALAGCGGARYAIVAGAAGHRLDEARRLHADQRAPYEYYYAKAHLEQAANDAARAHYSDAIQGARVADTYALRAVALSQVDDDRASARPSAPVREPAAGAAAPVAASSSAAPPPPAPPPPGVP